MIKIRHFQMDRTKTPIEAHLCGIYTRHLDALIVFEIGKCASDSFRPNLYAGVRTIRFICICSSLCQVLIDFLFTIFERQNGFRSSCVVPIQANDTVQFIQFETAYFIKIGRKEVEMSERGRVKSTASLAKAQCDLHFNIDSRFNFLPISGATKFTSVVSAHRLKPTNQ